MKKKRSTLIVYGACAVLWTMTTIISFMDKVYLDNMFLFCLNALCAVIWSCAFVVERKKYKANRS